MAATHMSDNDPFSSRFLLQLFSIFTCTDGKLPNTGSGKSGF